MARIVELLTEPSIMKVGDYFKVKIKIDDPYQFKQYIITENEIQLITENGNKLITEWGI